MAVSMFSFRAQRELSLTKLQRHHGTGIQVVLSLEWSSALLLLGPHGVSRIS